MVVNRYASQQAELEASLSQSRGQLEALQRAVAEREAEVQQLRQDKGASESSLSSRTAQLEAEVSSLRAAASAAESSVASLTVELQNARAHSDALEEKAKGKSSGNCSIAVEDSGSKEANDALLPGVLESGRSVKFSWGMTGQVHIQWYRAFKGGDWQTIPGKLAKKPSYTITADDIGACLKAEATHITTGQAVYAETSPVHPYTPLVKSLGDIVKKLDATFTVESANAQDADKSRRILLNKEKIKLQDAKGTPTHALRSTQANTAARLHPLTAVPLSLGCCARSGSRRA